MSWAEVKKTVDWLCEDLGYKPGNMRKFEASPIDETSIALRFLEPAESYIEDVLYSKPVGVIIRYGTGKYPENPDEGTLVIDNTNLGAYENDPYTVSGLTSGQMYYFSAFPYTAIGAVNTTGGVNRCESSPLKNEACTVTVVIDDASAFTSANITCVNETKTTQEVKQVTPQSLSVVFNVPEGDTYHIEFGEAEGYSKPANSDSYTAVGGGTRSVTGNYYYSTAKLTVECLPNTVVTCTMGEKVLTATATGTSAVFEHIPPGTWAVTGLLNGEATTSASVNITQNSGEYTCILAKIVPWSTGTDEEIVLMVKAADMGFIDLTDYWAVGQERTVHLSAMSGGGLISNNQPEEDLSFVLMHDDYPLADGSRASFVVGMKDCLYYSTKIINSPCVWDEMKIRTWLNSTFYNEGIPSSIRTIFKPMNVITSHVVDSSDHYPVTTNDYFALPAATEVANSNSTVDEENLFRFTYYQTTANWSKTGVTLSGRGVIGYWATRSTYIGPNIGRRNEMLCVVRNSSSIAGYDIAHDSYSIYISPFGCI